MFLGGAGDRTGRVVGGGTLPVSVAAGLVVAELPGVGQVEGGQPAPVESPVERHVDAARDRGAAAAACGCGRFGRESAIRKSRGWSGVGPIRKSRGRSGVEPIRKAEAGAGWDQSGKPRPEPSSTERRVRAMPAEP